MHQAGRRGERRVHRRDGAAGQARAATATAATDLTLLVSSAGEFKSILDLAPSVAEELRGRPRRCARPAAGPDTAADRQER